MTEQQEFAKIDKLWKLLDLTLQDLKAVERLPQYRVNIRQWYHEGTEDGQDILEVGVAGSVIALHFPEMMIYVSQLDSIWEMGDALSSRIFAIDDLSEGLVSKALTRITTQEYRFFKLRHKLESLDRAMSVYPPIRGYYDYVYDPCLGKYVDIDDYHAFWKDMYTLRDDLKKLDI